MIFALGCGPQGGSMEDGGTSLEPGSGTADTSDEPTSNSPTAVDPTTAGPTTEDPTTGDPTTGEPTTGDPPGGTCIEPQAGVEAVGLELALEPPLDFNEPLQIDDDCVIDERLGADGQGGLALRCKQDAGEVVLRATYDSGHLVLPDSAAVGLEVHVRAQTWSAEVRQSALLVTAKDDGRIVLGAHRGPGVSAFDGIGEDPEFWAPLIVDQAQPRGCPSLAGTCTSEIQRAAVRFALGDDEVELFDRQLGELGALKIHVGAVIESISEDNFCEGGTDATQDFVMVHSPA